ncbi:MAG: hypothetical protein P8171_25085 [Candidatus Thiodiazotropha sp.]
MDKQYTVKDGLTQCVAHTRLIAGLMITGPGMIDVEVYVYAMMLQDLAVRLERMTEVQWLDSSCPDETQGEERSC